MNRYLQWQPQQLRKDPFKRDYYGNKFDSGLLLGPIYLPAPALDSTKPTIDVEDH